MSQMHHLDDWTLEQLAEGMLSEQELTRATAHLEDCRRCAAELEGYRALYAALAEVPRLAPSAAFNDAVMARVRMPAPSPVWSAIHRWLPSTRRGWMLLGAALAAPALPIVWLVAWVMTQPGVSAGALLAQGVEDAGAAASALAAWLLELGFESGAFGWAVTLADAVQGVPLETFAAVFGVLAVAIPLSAWSLFRLVRTPMGNANYAN